MKIEIGESLMLSWLKHIRGCKITQLNWKPSNKWKKSNEIEVNNLFEELRENFSVFKQTKKMQLITLDQLIKQAEIDILGLNIENTNYYAIDIAYHENGLKYAKTKTKVLEKLLRSALVLLLYFDKREGNIIFASPKIGPTLYKNLHKKIEEINDFMKGQRYNYDFQLIANDDFRTLY